MVEFKGTPGEIERWLRKQPREAAVALAARAALRAVPALAPWVGTRRGAAHPMVLQVFRAVAVSWATANYPAHGKELAAFAAAARVAAVAARKAAFASRAARAAASAASGSAAFASVDAADAASVDAAAAFAAAGAAVARFASAPDRAAAAHSAAAIDMTALANGLESRHLAGWPLWRSGVPSWARDNWQALRAVLLGAREGWEVWTDWYEDRLEGRPSVESLELARATIAPDIWGKGPHVVNRHIKTLIEKHLASPTAQAADRGERVESSPGWDFFLSFSGADRAFAEWVERLLSAAGLRIFAQFNAIEAGSNFVVEMQRGLEGSRRFIALSSPDYWRSTHCQAEWSAAYNDDPNGAHRKIVALLVRAADLPPLARQIVNIGLIGLSPEDAAAKIWEALGMDRRRPMIPEGWPAEIATSEMRANLGAPVELRPGADNRLERAPAETSDDIGRRMGFGATQLYADMAAHMARFASYAKRGSGNYRCSERLQDCARRLKSAIPNEISACDPLALNRELVWTLRILVLDRADDRLPPTGEIEFFESDLRGHYKLLAKLFPDLVLYRKRSTELRFVEPTPEESEAILSYHRVLGDRGRTEKVLSPPLTEDFASAGESIERAKTLSEETGGRTADLTRETHMEAAARILSVWEWLSNAPAKFARSGKTIKEVGDAVKEYKKLYDTLSPAMSVGIKYLMGWLF